MNCPKCGAEIDTLVVNVQGSSEGCWPCIAGPDQMMLRKVVLETEARTEVVLVHARNNCEASWPDSDALMYFVRSQHQYTATSTCF
jgi:hypothetical protein